MRRTEQIVAAVLVLFSAYLIAKSTELPIGWIKDYGPGGGAFPFWVSIGMFICSALILTRSVLRRTAESKSDGPFIESKESVKEVLTVMAALTGLIAVTSGIRFFGVTLFPALGVYVAIPLFLLFYLRHIGRHKWVTTISISLATPVVTFLFFEKLLVILLPKGIIDAWFYIFF